jgi:hypothetical protein
LNLREDYDKTLDDPMESHMANSQTGNHHSGCQPQIFSVA